MNNQATTLNPIAEQYVKLQLAIGLHSQYYIDAYYGPADWKPTAKTPLSTLKQQVEALTEQLQQQQVTTEESLRKAFMLKHLVAASCYIDQLNQQPITFIEECQKLYDVTPPQFDESHFDQALTELDQLLTGSKSLNQKLAEFRQQFIVPVDKLDTVFGAAIDEARKRTLQHIQLPQNENFEVSQVTNQVWSAYNWYKGDSYSLIEVNTDHPIFIDRVIDLAAHEGYPGHHVFNALMEQHLVKQKGWMEYSLYALYSPCSLLAEGSANYGIEVAFEHHNRMKFEREVLFPLAGLNPELVEQYYSIQQVLHRLSYVDNMIAERYLDKQINHDQAVELTMTYALSSKERAQQRLKFIEHNRAYVINYNYGQDLVKDYLAKQCDASNNQQLWQAFEKILSNPLTGSMMQ